MVDYAFLQGLSGRRDWNSIKNERKNELEYQSAINSMRQQEIDRQAMLNQQMQEYYNTANELQVTPIGRDRINERVNNPMKEAIAEKIKKYGGDLDKYMQVEGATDMNNYLQTLVHSPETQRELSNASNISKWKADKEAGLQERLQFDATTGTFGGSFNEKLTEYLNGNTETLDYSGAFKPAKFNEDVFSKIYGDKNRYKSVPVSAQDYAGKAFRDLVDAGLPEQDAAQQAHILAKNYTKRVDEKGIPLRWKSDKYTPTNAYANDQNALISARFTIDQMDAVTDPNYNKWKQPKEIVVGQIDEKSGKQVGTRKAVMREADMVPIPLGKKTISYDEEVMEYQPEYLNGIATGNVIPKTVKGKTKNVTKEIDDAIEPILNVDGKLYIQTTANRLEGKKPIPLESKAINRIILATPKTPDGLRMIAAYRKVLAEKGVLDKEGLADFDLNNRQSQRYIDGSGNTVVDVDKLTPEQLQGLIDNGTISIAE